MRVTVDRPGWRDVDLARQIEIGDTIDHVLRRGVGRTPALLQQFGRHRGGRAEVVVGRAHVQMKFAGVVLVADVAVEAADVRTRKIAIAVVVHAFERAVHGKIVDLLAPLRAALNAPVGAPHGGDFGALMVEAILHLDVESTAQRIETEGRIVGDDVNRANGQGRDQVPVHGVAERLVDAHAVLIDREPLRGARHRR